MCAETDYMLGSVIQALKDFGLYNNTFIIFLSDHGEMNMEHRQVWKNSMYEASSRVPLIISPPPNMPSMRRGQTVTNLTSLLDIYPTLVEMAQLTKPSKEVKMPSFLSGHSLFPFLYEERHQRLRSNIPPYPKNRRVVSQYHSNMGNTGSFILRRGNYKYIAFGRKAYDPSYTPQLFDVVNDPEELLDLSFDKPKLAKALDLELREIIGDYYKIDAIARENDFKIYKRFFADKYDRAKLRKLFSAAYTGFDDDDMAKIDAWVKNQTLAQL
jgi:arylsulfatase K